MFSRPISLLACAAGLLLAFTVASFTIGDSFLRSAVGDTVPLLVLSATVFVSARNALDSRGHARLFWSLVTIGLAMWWFNQACWVWFEVILKQKYPEPFFADDILFLHAVPILAAVTIRPHQADQSQGLLQSSLNVLTLLMWWVVVFAFFVFPEEYVAVNLRVYDARWDDLYMIEGLILILACGYAYSTSSGSWRKLYASIFGATILYNISSQVINLAIARGTYQTGGPYDIPYLGAALGFLVVTLVGRGLLRETEATSSASPSRRSIASALAQLALLSLPVMAYATLFLGQDPRNLRRVRFVVAICGLAVLAFFVFLKQYLLDRRLLQLLDRSRKSFDNLQRLQGRAVQQAKLASLGELVALAASELEYPLSVIMGHSEKMAASSSLDREQLSTAQKIGQQARRTSELVADLLRFAQQTSGEKAPLELKPLLQRAIQMEGFKLGHRNIALTIECMDPMPRVFGNSSQLLQAFVQIVENAVDALREVGGGRLQISLWRESEDVVLQFADSGPGLRDPERVFDPFYTTKPVGKGTGLGLSATYGVVQDHKGQITCYNRPEGGAAFEIRLPVFRAGTPATTAAHA